MNLDVDLWREQVFITFDIDWANDDVLSDTINLIEGANVPATWFVTHSTPLLERLKANKNFELGIHPNFNNLLNGDATKDGMREIVKNIRDLVPSAVSIRSHSLTQNSKLLDVFIEYGFTHDVNLFIPAQSGIALRPFSHLGRLVRAPFFWEDDVHCTLQNYGSASGWQVGEFLDHPGLKIFNFHPIHTFLNTEHLSRYERCHGFHKNTARLAEQKNNSLLEGTRCFLNSLIYEAKARKMSFGLIREIEVAN